MKRQPPDEPQPQIDLDLWRRRYYVFDGAPDSKGYRSFTTYYLTSYPNCNRHQSIETPIGRMYPRGQCFHANPAAILHTNDIQGLPPWME